mmetsp:Transcript_23516/g.63732  ORF Transcript_23516/g.63732 Transcript_23516/m.63732 type:complete len:355 (-) Transcript_23516:293-1357(-)
MCFHRASASWSSAVITLPALRPCLGLGIVYRCPRVDMMRCFTCSGMGSTRSRPWRSTTMATRTRVALPQCPQNSRSISWAMRKQPEHCLPHCLTLFMTRPSADRSFMPMRMITFCMAKSVVMQHTSVESSGTWPKRASRRCACLTLSVVIQGRSSSSGLGPPGAGLRAAPDRVGPGVSEATGGMKAHAARAQPGRRDHVDSSRGGAGASAASVCSSSCGAVSLTRTRRSEHATKLRLMMGHVISLLKLSASSASATRRASAASSAESGESSSPSAGLSEPAPSLNLLPPPPWVPAGALGGWGTRCGGTRGGPRGPGLCTCMGLGVSRRCFAPFDSFSSIHVSARIFRSGCDKAA